MTENHKYIFGHIHLLTFVVVVIFIIFLIFSHIHQLTFVVVVIFIIFSCSKFNVRHCQFFGHVHQFWSYLFGHLDSIKWITLKKIANPREVFQGTLDRKHCFNGSVTIIFWILFFTLVDFVTFLFNFVTKFANIYEAFSDGFSSWGASSVSQLEFSLKNNKIVNLHIFLNSTAGCIKSQNLNISTNNTSKVSGVYNPFFMVHSSCVCKICFSLAMQPSLTISFVYKAEMVTY